MMKKEGRKAVQKDTNSIEQLINHWTWSKTILIDSHGESFFKETLQKLTQSLEKLNEKYEKLPFGHRYEGTYFLKKPSTSYTQPLEFEEKSGVLFMREHQVSWALKNEPYTYHRNVYKKPDLSSLLKREDGTEIFNSSQL